MRVDVLTIFPDMFSAPMSASMLGIARQKGALEFFAHDLRTWTHDFHRTVDDSPYGGGQGMVMKPAPLFEGVEAVAALDERKPTVIFFTPTGRTFTQDMAEELACQERLLMVCGRYEGFDQRPVDALADIELSIGDYVLTGGELPAMMVTDAVTRLLPGVLGDEMSAVDESFSSGLLEYPQYTRPALYRDMPVPEILLSGNHGAVDVWRHEQAMKRTRKRRPDLLKENDER
ncbi:MAG: tRNA (guanosine(37)-N1)-methyltransferase TrmD [Coriobacteriia bacterium]|nr:tRNA (guanosine(37)-N1)-methyltransferase TrmD [Coriobacteriia bacterium]